MVEKSSQIRLIVGLGNPGEKYQETRHNAGFLMLQKLAQRHGWVFKNEKRFLGQLAKGAIGGQIAYLLLPTTYMNDSGRSLRKALDFFKVKPEEVLVILDDIHLALGGLRLRSSGGTGGHNGLKSIQSHLSSTQYSRLRIGIGQGDFSDQVGHVLGRFRRDEREALEEVFDKACDIVEKLLLGSSVEELQGTANRRVSGKQQSSSENAAGEQK